MEVKDEEVLEVKYKIMGMGIKQPKFATDGSSCFDLYAAEDAVIEPSQTVAVGLGVAFEPPEGYGIMIYPRSGISSKVPLRFANGVGVIDNDYRGEVKVLLENVRPEKQKIYKVPAYQLVDGTTVEDYNKYYPEGTIKVRKGDRIAQGMVVQTFKTNLSKSKELSETKRGKGGFGSTGVK